MRRFLLTWNTIDLLWSAYSNFCAKKWTNYIWIYMYSIYIYSLLISKFCKKKLFIWSVVRSKYIKQSLPWVCPSIWYQKIQSLISSFSFQLILGFWVSVERGVIVLLDNGEIFRNFDQNFEYMHCLLLQFFCDNWDMMSDSGKKIKNSGDISLITSVFPVSLFFSSSSDLIWFIHKCLKGVGLLCMDTLSCIHGVGRWHW